ncbi:MAG TPA: DUF1573 domain-containing protein [Tenuifilaceae bacterium]|nr:DUF1573 domain-containing protein [Tenuifilaceae bacterium]HPE18203.1 DUF1573 domain-containing protein [Tenuifilaceae bacterium]HPJ45486.1 DUF1573 domain-containing protein [Tenuifilaceae bacterium]HPQ33893.1 DUF1573 domain-containing protein [Tenuifilaceae bacterium]HRX68246.1 DUF1573 domain-containing protein [Tenuifilaceae bacterium]
MRTLSFVFSIVLAFSLATNAQNKAASISPVKTVHDFGTIKEEDGKVSFDFEITNDGEAPLIINRVSSSCGCTTPVWPKEPIPPGGKGSVKATYDPKGRPGPFNKTITIFSNASASGTVLSIKGQVTPRTKTPEETYRKRIGDLGLANSHMSMGKLFLSEIRIDSLPVYNFGSEPMEITFQNVPKHITVTAEPKVLKPKEKGSIIVLFDSNKQNDWGFIIERVRLQLNGESPQGNLLSVSANIEEDFSKLTEEELAKAPKIVFNELNKDFGTIDEGSPVEYEFVFTNQGESDLIIRKIKASCGCTTVAPKVTVIKPGESSSLSASFRTKGYSGRQSKSITVITNDPKQSTIVLRLTGVVNKK